MPSTQLRQTVLAKARRIVVKMGTNLVCNRQGGCVGVDEAFLRKLAAQVAALRGRGFEVTLVSSGAMGSGRAELGLASRPRDVAAQQAVAAVGQRRLMTHYYEAFKPHELKVAQILLTREDFDDRLRFLNVRNCIMHVHQYGCVPVINENDTITVAGLQEIGFGDNDRLAALVCNCLRADALILLSVVDGLLDADGKKVELVEDVDRVLDLARTDRSSMGTGGMKSKLEAARLVTDAGEIAVIANGREENVLLRLFDAEKLGTAFVPAPRKLDSRQRWIGLTKRPTGTATIDDGAVTALLAGKSLLATGITATTGLFERGDALLVRDRAGREIARGLSNYASDELRLIMGKKSNQFEKILGRVAYTEVIHRDNLVLLGP